MGGPFKTRTALHVVCDWPGYFPNGPQIVRLLITAGADPNYRDPEPRSETPVHPERGFVSRDQVRLTWEQIFAAIPDVTTEVLRCVVDGDTVWSEWEHRGTRPDRSRHVMRGVIIFGVRRRTGRLGAFLPRTRPGRRGRRGGVRATPGRPVVILVAGGTGRLGTLVVHRLASRGLEVRVLTRDPHRAAHLLGFAEVVTGDVRDATAVTEVVAGVETVSAVHGFVGPGNVSPATVDRDGNANLTDAAKGATAGLVLMSIVGAAADSPMELHRMKHAAEQYAVSSGVPTTIVRASAFMELWIDLLRQTAIRSGRPLVFGRGDNPVNFVSVADVASLIDTVTTESGSRGRTFEIGGPGNLSFNQLATAVQSADGRTRSPRHVPPAMLWLTANTVGRFKPELARQTRAALAMDRTDLTLDTTPIRQIYPSLPNTSLADVLSERGVG